MTGRESLIPDAPQSPVVAAIEVGFQLLTWKCGDHPHPEYTHRCDVTVAGERLWSRWGKSAAEAEKAARWEVGVRLRRAFGG